MIFKKNKALYNILKFFKDFTRKKDAQENTLLNCL